MYLAVVLMGPMASGDPTQLMQQEAARVLIINGSGWMGLARKPMII